MKSALKALAAITIVLALAFALTYLALYLLYAAVVISLFYSTLLYLIGATTFAVFTLWIGRKVFSRHGDYKLLR